MRRRDFITLLGSAIPVAEAWKRSAVQKDKPHQLDKLRAADGVTDERLGRALIEMSGFVG